MQGLFDEMKSGACLVTPVTLSNVMLWYFKAKDVTSVVEHWRMMRQSGARLSAAIYAAYIDFALSAKQYKRVAVVFEEMLNNGSLPNSRIYAIFIQHLVDNGKLDAATKILELMQTMHLVPCRVTYKTLVNEYARNGDLDKAQALLVEMKEHFHKPTKQLMPVVRALQAAGKIEEATALLEEITAVSQLNFDDKIYSSDEEYVSDSECTLSEWRAISCLHPGFDVNAFAQVLHPWEPRMIEVLAQADVQWEHYLVMGIFKRLKNIDSIWPFFHWLKDNAGFKHDNYTCGALIHRIFKSKLNLERKAFLVKELFEGLRHENIKFTVPIFNTVMRYFVAAGEGDKALSMFSLMKDLGIEPNNISYSLAVEGCAKNHQLKRVTELLQEVQLKSFHLTSTACAQYITCLASLGKINDAYNFFCHMRTLEKGCSSVEYKAIISAFDRARDHAMAFQMYEEMRAAGIEPTQDMYELIIRVLQQANRLTEVNVMAEERRLLSFFGGNKKEMQEKLLQVLFLLIKSLKPKKSEKCVPNAVI
ncbi:hypothetical protein KP509_11G091600 [Ceratopteris richardii]|nr:hypothetical protein KP509_11G091600 [Ceratopteris richardii]